MNNSYRINELTSQIEGMQMDINEKKAKVYDLWRGVKDFASADYVKAERVGKLILSIRGEINSLNKKIKATQKMVDDMSGS